MKIRKIVALFVCLGLISMLAAACGSGNNVGSAGQQAADNPKPKVNQDPVELIVYSQIYSEKDFDEQYRKPLQSKFPWVTFKYIQQGKGNTLPELIGSGTIPDFFYTNSSQLEAIKDVGLNFDLTPMIKQNKMDLNRFADGVIDTLKTVGEGAIPGIPMFITPHVLHYNKDIFDKFGVAYPKDDMTWKDLVEVAAKIGAKSDGSIRPFDFQISPAITFNQLSLSPIDPKTKKASVNNASWKELFQTFKAVYDVPNNQPNEKNIGDSDTAFLKDKTLAMRVGHNKIWELPAAIEGGLNFDMATMPYFPQAPHKQVQYVGVMMAISAQSKHKDLIFDMLSYLVSDEVQTQNARSAGNLTVLKDKKIIDQFVADVPFMKGKNIGAMTKPLLAPSSPYTPLVADTKANSIMQTELKNFMLNKK
ncbi:MAG: family 1 extracellular solute-binding protein, partial [Paenibacillaceae bacterium]|nr:family 1 extracellular solute-binding protein [Paenibacillaceae bacterium]